MTIGASGAMEEMIIVSSMTEMHPLKSKGIQNHTAMK